MIHLDGVAFCRSVTRIACVVAEPGRCPSLVSCCLSRAEDARNHFAVLAILRVRLAATSVAAVSVPKKSSKQPLTATDALLIVRARPAATTHREERVILRLDRTTTIL